MNDCTTTCKEVNVWDEGCSSLSPANGCCNVSNGEQRFVAIEGQQLFQLTAFEYAPGTNSLEIHQQGLQVDPVDLIELSKTTFWLQKDVNAGDIIVANGLTCVTSEVAILVSNLSTYAVNLMDGQLEITFPSEVPIEYSAFYINGLHTDNGRLVENVDYTKNLITNAILLIDSYPAGTTLLLAYNDVGEGVSPAAIVPKDSVAGIRADFALASTSVTGQQISLSGYYEDTILGGGIFIWDADSTDADDGGYTLLPTTWTLPGRWKRKLTDTVSIADFGARVNGDRLGDDILPIKAAIIYATEQDIKAIYIPPGTGNCIVSEGVPLPKRIRLYADTKDSSVIDCIGSTATIYTATLANGVFTDNLDATIGEISNKSKSAQGASIVDIGVIQSGQITGNAPSGAAWAYAVQIVGAYDGFFDDINASAQQNDIGGMDFKYCWRAELYELLSPRGSAYTGGIGINIGSNCNSSIVIGPKAQGPYDIGLKIAAVEAITVIEPRCEGPDIGYMFSGNSVRTIGGYYEGGITDIQIGDGESPAVNYLLESPWINGSRVGGAETAINIESAVRGRIKQPHFTGTHTSRWKSTASAAFNYANTIEINTSDASQVDLAALGLLGGRNIVKAIGEDNSPTTIKGYAEYSTTNGSMTATSALVKDYTFGTFTPTLIAGTSGTITLSASAKTLSYTRIGRMVHINGRIDIASVSSPSGTLNMGGLPFTILAGAERSESSAISFEAQFTTAYSFYGSTDVAGGTNMRVHGRDGAGASDTTPADQIIAGSVFISGFYLTDEA